MAEAVINESTGQTYLYRSNGHYIEDDDVRTVDCIFLTFSFDYSPYQVINNGDTLSQDQYDAIVNNQGTRILKNNLYHYKVAAGKWACVTPTGILSLIEIDSSTRVVTISTVSLGGSGSGAAWGQITGTLSDQTDLQSALNNISASASNAANDATSALSAAQSASNDASSALSAAQQASNDASNANTAAANAMNAALQASSDASNASSSALAAYSAANNAANDAANASSLAQSAYNAANNAANDATSALSVANSKSVVTGTNDGTNWTYIAIDGVNKAIPAGGGGGGGSDVLDLSSYSNWSTLSAADQTAVQTALLVKHGGLIFTRTERGDDTDNSNYHFVNIAVADGNPASGPFEQLKELDICINKSTYEFNKYEITKFRVLDTDRAGYDSYYAPTDYTVLRATKPWAYYASPDFAFDQLVDNSTIVYDSNGHIKTTVGGSSMVPTISVDDSDISGAASHLDFNDSDIFTFIDQYYHEATIPELKIHLTVHNPTENVDYTQTVTINTGNGGAGIGWDSNAWRKYFYGPDKIQYAEDTYLDNSTITIDSSKLRFFNASAMVSAGCTVSNVSIDLATQYTTLDANYLPIDNSTITINNGKIQAALPASPTVTSLNVDGGRGNFPYSITSPAAYNLQLSCDNYHGVKLTSNDFYPLGLIKNLGTSGNKWENVYLSGNLSDGTNTATVADIAALIAYAKGQG